MRKISILFIIVGVCFIGIGGYQWIKTQKSQSETMAEARTLLDNKDDESQAADKQKHPSDTFNPSAGETAGVLHIPKLDSDLPIVEGTHEDDLEKGVGHYAGTAYPLEKDQIVLSGHRDTVFRRMGELDIGDILTVKTTYGDFSYEITDTEIVDANDRTVITSTSPDEILTLTTCYPFSYIGNAPDRYIINAVPVSENN